MNTRISIPTGKRYHTINGVNFEETTNALTGKREFFFEIDISCLEPLKLLIPTPLQGYEQNDNSGTLETRARGRALPKRTIRAKTTSLYYLAS